MPKLAGHAGFTVAANSEKRSGDGRLRRERFVAAFIANGGKKYEAAIEAGYAPRSSAGQATKLMHHPHVQQLLREHQAKVEAELKAKYAITRESVLDALSNLVYGNPQTLFDDDGRLLPIKALDERTAKMVSSIEVEEFRDRETGEVKSVTKKIRLWDKNSAIDKAMKYLGLFERDNAQKPAVVQLTPDDAKVL